MYSVSARSVGRIGFLTMLLCIFATLSLSAAEPASKRELLGKYEPMLIAEDLGEAAMQTARLKLSNLSKSEILEFIATSRTWLRASELLHQRAILSFEVIRGNNEFDKTTARAMLKAVTDARVGRPIDQSKALDSIVEKRLVLFLAAKVGQLDAARIESELNFIADEKRDSVERVGMAGALVDAMGETAKGEVKPTAAQLEKLLKNDVSDLRILAVDWFRLAPPADPGDRTRFLIAALKTNPRQVSESASRACDADVSPVVREKCGKAKPKSDKP